MTIAKCECGHWIGDHRRILLTESCKLSIFYRCDVQDCKCEDEPQMVYND